MKSLLIPLLAAGAGVAKLAAAPPEPATSPEALAMAQAAAADEKAPNILVDMQILRVPRAIAQPLTAELLSEKTAAAAAVKIQELLAKGEITLVAWPMVLTRGGSRATIEALHEIRYPTSYLPGGVELHFETKDGKIEQVSDRVPGINLNPVARDFETRNAGVMLEVEPMLSPDGQTISLNINPQHVVLKGMRKSSIERHSDANPKGTEQVVAEQPDFLSLKTTASLKLKNGARVLLAVFPSPDAPEESLELFVLHVATREP